MAAFTTFIRSPFARTAAAVALAGSLLAPIAAQAAPAPAVSKAPTWATYDPATKTAHLRIIAAYGQDTNNFDGGTRGHFTLTVPLGAKVIVTYSNNSAHMPHGMEIVRYTGSLPLSKIPKPAFPGAESPNAVHGTMKGVTQTITFTASKAGKYLLICPVKNHVKFGHWDWFIVSAKAKTATGVLK